ncbi:MAG: hypothetical protein DCF31_17510, partial [Alphaproteobacteria bacterium]
PHLPPSAVGGGSRMAAFALVADTWRKIYSEEMQRRLAMPIVTVGLPTLAGQFVFGWATSDLRSALGQLPMRAAVVLAILLLWAMFREHRERRKRTFR